MKIEQTFTIETEEQRERVIRMIQGASFLDSKGRSFIVTMSRENPDKVKSKKALFNIWCRQLATAAGEPAPMMKLRVKAHLLLPVEVTSPNGKTHWVLPSTEDMGEDELQELLDGTKVLADEYYGIKLFSKNDRNAP